MTTSLQFVLTELPDKVDDIQHHYLVFQMAGWDDDDEKRKKK